MLPLLPSPVDTVPLHGTPFLLGLRFWTRPVYWAFTNVLSGGLGALLLQSVAVSIHLVPGSLAICAGLVWSHRCERLRRWARRWPRMLEPAKTRRFEPLNRIKPS